jgi:hypothetical protein
MDTWGETLNVDEHGSFMENPMIWVEEEISFIDLHI